ncbi:MAG: hypothetical protein EZS28_013568 [Streblomastix strix]|uniref:Uncharacterized protein n=1 Tax=Streblomastix strix TaxID=222440 RepID=A0A5J4W857_9EUKA|nr:MAG: hypothetical protein EZS28_013568 [Streblomastix strix]
MEGQVCIRTYAKDKLNRIEYKLDQFLVVLNHLLNFISSLKTLIASLTEQELQQILDQEEINARKEFEAEKSQQGSGGAGGQGLMEVDGMDDDYDYYESQANRQDSMKSRAKPEEAGDVLATLVGYLNRDIKKINRLSSAVSAQQYIQDKHLGKRFSLLEQYLDDNQATPDNVVVFDKKKNAIYSVNDYTTAVKFGDPEHQHKRNWKKQYYTDVNDLERTALAAKLKQQDIKEKQRIIVSEHLTPMPKKVIDQNGGAKLPMATKQQIRASVWNSVLIIPAVDVLEQQDGKIDIYNRSNKTKIQQGQYEFLPLAKRLYKKELPAVIAQLYQAEDVDTRIKQALGQAMQYYGQMLTQRQQQAGGFDLAKYKFQ